MSSQSIEELISKLDSSWIERGLRKRANNFSNVLCFETRDPVRIQQLQSYLPSCPWGQEAEIYWYTPWQGLIRLVGKDRGFSRPPAPAEPVEDRDAEAVYKAAEAPRETPRILALKTALQHMDRLLRERKTLFVLHNLEESLGTTSAREGSISRALEEQRDLINAIRDWALDSQIQGKDSLIIILAGNIARVLDEYTIELIALERPSLSSDPERREIISNRTSKGPLKICSGEVEKLQERLVELTKGLNLHQLWCALRESYDTINKNIDLAKLKELKADFIKRSNLLEIEEEPIQCPECKLQNDSTASICQNCGRNLSNQRGFRRIGGYQTIKDFITQNLIHALSNPDRFKKFAIPPPRGILLFGPPGTGKTLFAKCLAQEINVPFVNLKTENLISPWLGESGRRFGEAIRLIEQMSPAIVFIDEIDKFGKRRGTVHDSAGEETRRVLNQVLEWLGQENRKSIIVGATNRPGDLDKAFLRAGRFDYKIPVLWPDRAAREQILQIHLGLTGIKPKPLLSPGVEKGLNSLLQSLASQTSLFSGAEIEQLVTRAKRIGASRSTEEGLKEEDFSQALQNFRINRPARISDEVIPSVCDVLIYTDDATFLAEIDRITDELGLKKDDLFRECERIQQSMQLMDSF